MRIIVLGLVVACGSSSNSVVDAPHDTASLDAFDAFADGAPATLRYRGTNLSGAEFGTAPGTFGTDYIYPDPSYQAGYASPSYFVGKGMTAFRLPFLWERLQRSLNVALDTTELARLDTTVAHLTAMGAYVVLDAHNYARYNGVLVGSTQVPATPFADFWSRLATHFATNDHVIFGLMNEPHDMPTEQWRDCANAAIAAIRTAGAHNVIFVPGNAWTGAWSWTQSFYGTANATVMLDIVDPENHVVFEVHQYLDSDYSGSHVPCQSATIGASSLGGFTEWLRDHGKRGLLGEVGTSNDPTCLTALDGMLAHIDANKDVWTGWTWWSAGPWWGNYFMTLEPKNGADAPQMAVLVNHL
jgi:endoglucanase